MIKNFQDVVSIISANGLSAALDKSTIEIRDGDCIVVIETENNVGTFMDNLYLKIQEENNTDDEKYDQIEAFRDKCQKTLDAIAESMVLDNDLVETVLNESASFNFHKNAKGQYEEEVYIDYRDALKEFTVKEILGSKCPRETLNDILFDMFAEADDELYDSYITTIRDYINENYPDVNGVYNDKVNEWAWENVYVLYPMEHYLNHKYPVDIIVDTGDGNYDFTLNSVFPHYNGNYNDTTSDKASIVWLSKMLGYTKTQMNNALKNEVYNGSKFLESLRYEVANCTSHMNALTFMVSMSLDDLISITERLDVNKRNDCIIIKKGCTAGLYDSGNGAGSVLELEIEKDIKLPLKFIHSVNIDSDSGYSIRETYGLGSDTSIFCDKFSI